MLGAVALVATTSPVLARPTPNPGPGCDPTRRAVAHHAGGAVLDPQPQGAPIACGMFTGYGGAEARVGVTNDGAVVYEPAVLTPGIAGTGYVPGAPGSRPQTQVSPGGLAVTRHDGRTWRIVRPAN